jgi:hypothetical protein
MSWKQQIRQFQDERENAGWRIQMIPYDDSSRPMTVETNWIATVGAIGFIVGAVLLIRNPGKDTNLWLGLAVGSLLLAFFGIWFQARRQRKDWEVETARCVDRELQKFRLPKGGGWGWFWRIVCEYEFHGEKFRVTPNVHQWINLSSEETAMKFIGENISPDGECKLHVNPKNPLQTELVGRSVRDKFLY